MSVSHMGLPTEFVYTNRGRRRRRTHRNRTARRLSQSTVLQMPSPRAQAWRTFIEAT